MDQTETKIMQIWRNHEFVFVKIDIENQKNYKTAENQRWKEIIVKCQLNHPYV